MAVLRVCFLLAGLLASSANARDRPNILLFIGDDIDHSYYGFQDHDFVKTPHLDRLAAEGVVFENGYATASACRPSTRTLIYGLRSRTWENLALRIGARHPGTPRYRESQHVVFTLPRLLRRAGYASFAGGKMWEGSYRDAGFDAGTMKEPPSALKPLWVDGARSFARESMDELYRFIEAQPGPWFAWVAPELPHVPHDPPQELRDLYADLGLSEQAIAYFANLTRMDLRVGEILSYLDDRGLADDTVVLYVSDNGWVQHPTEMSPHHAALGDDGGKLSAHDRGFHTPIIVRWPAEIRPARRTRALVNFEDLFETILDYAGAPSHPCSRGESFRRVATDAAAEWNRRRIFGRTQRTRFPIAEVSASNRDGDPSNDKPRANNNVGLFVRDGQRWAFSYVPDRDDERLYDLARDPLGLVDVAARHPERVAKMRSHARSFYRSLGRRKCRVSEAVSLD